jgi:hypothetical protein
MEPEDPALHGQVLVQLEADVPVNHRVMSDFTETELSPKPRARPVRPCKTCRPSPSLYFVVTNCCFVFLSNYSL